MGQAYFCGHFYLRIFTMMHFDKWYDASLNDDMIYGRITNQNQYKTLIEYIVLVFFFFFNFY